MAAAALSGNLYAAYGYNKLLFLTLPIIAADLIFEEIRYIKSGARNLSLISRVFIYSEIAALILFGIIRNIL